MKKTLILSLFMSISLAWAAAQQPGNLPQGSAGQSTSGSAQVPDTTQSSPSKPGGTGQNVPQGGVQGQNVTVTEGCLGGSNPNYTITDAAGTTYKLNIPPGADASSLQAHVGEPVAVMGAVNKGTAAPADQSSINVSKMGRGSGQCPSQSNSTGAPPRQKP